MRQAALGLLPIENIVILLGLIETYHYIKSAQSKAGNEDVRHNLAVPFGAISNFMRPKDDKTARLTYGVVVWLHWRSS